MTKKLNWNFGKFTLGSIILLIVGVVLYFRKGLDYIIDGMLSWTFFGLFAAGIISIIIIKANKITIKKLFK